MILLKGADETGKTILVVASHGVWDTYAASFEGQLVKQFGPAIGPFSQAQMAGKKAIYG